MEQSKMKLGLIGAGLFFAVGCSSTPAVTDSCAPIVAACHDVDPGSGPLHDCHEVGHDEVEAACAAQRANCVALCTAAAADGGHNHDGGVNDSGSDAADHDHDDHHNH